MRQVGLAIHLEPGEVFSMLLESAGTFTFMTTISCEIKNGATLILNVLFVLLSSYSRFSLL